jgi:protoheme IX farnesyltransferase
VNVSPSADLAPQPLWREYLTLTKPGIIRSNLFTTFGGFWLAAQGQLTSNLLLLLIVLLGTSLVMASACVFNNYFDRDRDHLMERTQKRALVTGRISPLNVLLFAIFLGITGLLLFALFVHWLALIWAVVGMFVYIVIYTLWLKRSSTHSTLVGGISGAVPPVIGYVAVSETMDVAAWALFLILFIWQPPHFFALAIRRVEEYRAANFPLLPVVKGIPITKVQMVIYILLMVPCILLLFLYDYTGIIYLIGALSLTGIWLFLAIRGFYVTENSIWARNTFLYSIAYLILLFVLIMVDTVKA